MKNILTQRNRASAESLKVILLKCLTSKAARVKYEHRLVEMLGCSIRSKYLKESIESELSLISDRLNSDYYELREKQILKEEKARAKASKR